MAFHDVTAVPTMPVIAPGNTVLASRVANNKLRPLARACAWPPALVFEIDFARPRDGHRRK